MARVIPRSVGASAREVLVSCDPDLGTRLSEFVAPIARLRVVARCDDVLTEVDASPDRVVVLAPPASKPPNMEVIRALRVRAPSAPTIVCTYLRHGNQANKLRLMGAEVVFRPDVLPSLHLLLTRSLQRRTDAVRRATLACSIVRRRYRLSARETELLELVTIGLPRKSLSCELGVSENTTKTLIRRILLKVHEPSIEAVARAALEEALEHATDELASTTGDP